jgi:hypothetical protein
MAQQWQNIVDYFFSSGFIDFSQQWLAINSAHFDTSFF